MPTTAPDIGTIRARLAQVRERIAACAERHGRAPAEVTLIAVSKTHPAEMVREAFAAGARDFGENRVQEADEKVPALEGVSARWHLIGHLQSNKARRAVRLFDVIHSIDSLSLAERLERLCLEEERARLPVLVQIDLVGEATKDGADEAELPALIERLKSCERLQLVGLMTLPPFFSEVERVRPYFRRLRELRDEWQRRGAFGADGVVVGELSMGMSHDYEIAIAEGATMVRVGTAIFGARSKV